MSGTVPGEAGSVSESPVLRTLGEEDLREVLEIEHRSFSTPWSERTFRAFLRRPDAETIGAFAGDRLVGYVIGWVVLDQAELGNLAVAADERRAGVGRLLVGQLLDRFRARGVRECFLEVRASNEAARRIYAAHGFEPLATRREYYSNPVEDAVVMRRGGSGVF